MTLRIRTFFALCSLGLNNVEGSFFVYIYRHGNEFKPRPVLDDYLFTRIAFKKHMESQMKTYRKQYLVSLVDHHGGEQELGEAYEMQFRLHNDNRIRYTAFDFHENTRNLDQLVQYLDSSLQEFGYFMCKEGEILTYQTGVVRTNCVDCLDRTNVVQSLIAKRVLEDQLIRLGYIFQYQKVTEFLEFENTFKNVWIENADALSKRYTGTDALKTDFTKGKWSLRGTMTDGMNSAKRFINKNFKDDQKQEAIDLFFGKFTPCVHKLENSNGAFVWNIGKTSSNTFESQIVIDPQENLFIQFSSLRLHIKTFPISSIVHWSRHRNHHDLLLVFDNGDSKDYSFPTALHREFFINILYYCINNKKELIPEILEREKAIRSLIDGRYRSSPMLPSSTPSVGPITGKKQPLLGGPTNNRVGSTRVDGPQPLSGAAATGAGTPQKRVQSSLPASHSPPNNLQMVPKATASENGSKKPNPFLEKHNIFIGCWNMASCNMKGLQADWIPKGKDIYAISTQNCNYKVGDEFSFGCTSHWSYLVQSHLGPEYMPIATMNSEKTSLIILVKESLIKHVSSIEKFYVSGKENLSTTRKKIRDKFFSFGLTGKEKEDKPQKNIIGTAIGFWFNDTSLCIVNTHATEQPFDELDVWFGYSHIFWVGPINPAQVNINKWVGLYSDSNGAIYWRLVEHLQFHQLFTECNKQNSPYMPISISFSTEFTKLEFPTMSRPKEVLVLNNLRLSESPISLTVGYPTTHLKFHAPFLACDVSTPRSSRYANSNNEIAWGEQLILTPFLGEKDYLKQKSLFVELVAQGNLEDETVLGVGVISLFHAVGPLPKDFNCYLITDEPTTIIVHGTVQIQALK
eukprot:TRINITY_DN307_c0_g1_i2.p1 TRINITY_DN307_c0_g1~~TRINITY_DN307_c0_g1_i2.p1  ORF type:complete len:855 (-),score=116.70 TRINITY_DN307_c0_g1_i2:55-2619(-)